MQSDWDASAEAWIESLKTGGDFSRVAVLDRPMLAVVHASGARRVLDVGCGEGRFCRMISETVPQVVGLDPTAWLLSEARKLGGAQYAQGRAEDMPFEDRDFDMVVSYLSLIDIPDNAAAIAEMARVVRPGGYVLIANLNSWVTAAQTKGRGVVRNKQGHSTMTVANYLTPHWYWAKWRGVKIKNWHRPVSQYMREALQAGLRLEDFQEPLADAGWARSESYNHAPYFWLQLWGKPE